jgi:hypothetical protein
MKSVKGSVTVMTGGKEKIITIPTILKVPNKPLSHSDLADNDIAISYEQSVDGEYVDLDFEIREGSVGFVELGLVDAAGKSVKGSSWGSSKWGHSDIVNYHVRGKKAKFKGASLQVTIREGSKKVILPFEAVVEAEKSDTSDTSDTSLFKYAPTDGGVMITGYSDKQVEVLTIPSKIKGKRVTRIGNTAFQEFKNLKRITIPTSVTRIGAMSFSHCKSLSTITIPDSVKSFGSLAFQHSGLTSVTLPSGIKTIPSGVFAFCKNLTTITVPKGVTSIGEFSFAVCPNLKEIHFLGNAPKFDAKTLLNSTPTIYRKPGTKGWGKTWAGRPVLARSSLAD